MKILFRICLTLVISMAGLTVTAPPASADSYPIYSALETLGADTELCRYYCNNNRNAVRLWQYIMWLDNHDMGTTSCSAFVDGQFGPNTQRRTGNWEWRLGVPVNGRVEHNPGDYDDNWDGVRPYVNQVAYGYTDQEGWYYGQYLRQVRIHGTYEGQRGPVLELFHYAWYDAKKQQYYPDVTIFPTCNGWFSYDYGVIGDVY